LASSAPAYLGFPASRTGGKGDHVLGSLSVTHSEGCSWGTDRSERERMTTRKHLKRRARTRATLTGEAYASALQKIRRGQLEERMSTASNNIVDVIASCSFCAKPSTEVSKLVAGPGVFICNECVDLSATVIAATADETKDESDRRRAEYVDRSPQDILALLPSLARSATRVETDVARWVGRLREQGTDWQQIGEALGTSADAARRQFEGKPAIT
jgi:hypothetical protein